MLLVPAGSLEAYRTSEGWSLFERTGIIGDPASIPNFGSLIWSLKDGVLTVNGSGTMPDDYPPPWYEYKNGIISVIIGNDVSSICRNAFSNCSKLTSVTIGRSVETIGDDAFNNCSSLTEIVNYRETPQIIREHVSNSNHMGYIYIGAFHDVKKSECVLHVPVISLETYRTAEVWKDFVNIKPIQ